MEFRTSADVLTKEVELIYDVGDRLIRKEVDADGNGTVDSTEKLVYDGGNVALVFDGAGSLENRYLYGPNLDQVFADEDALGEILWALADNQGTVRDLAEYDPGTDSTSVANHIQYDAFGNITAESNSSVEFRHAFTGQDWDADLGMYNYGARWYEAVTALFMSEDPSGFAAGDGNLYRYVGNNPVNFTDPSGRTGVANNAPYAGTPFGDSAGYAAYMEQFSALSQTPPPGWSPGGGSWLDSYANWFNGTSVTAAYSQWLGSGFQQMLGNEYLAQATDAELYLLTVGSAVGGAAVGAGAGAVAGAAGVGAVGVGVTAGATGAITDYMIWTMGSFWMSDDEAPAPGPTWGGVATSGTIGAVTGGVIGAVWPGGGAGGIADDIIDDLGPPGPPTRPGPVIVELPPGNGGNLMPPGRTPVPPYLPDTPMPPGWSPLPDPMPPGRPPLFPPGRF